MVAAELRPPRAELGATASMDAWIDTYHAVRSLTRSGTPVFLTDSAVGLKEEDNLRHLVSNLGTDVPRSAIVPFLTCKHPMEYCIGYADRAVQQGFEALVVLGGDKSVGPPRCVEHAWQLREEIRKHQPRPVAGRLGQSACESRRTGRPSAGPRRDRRVLPDADRLAPQPARVEAFVDEAARTAADDCRGCSASSTTARRTPRTLAALKSFLPVPAAELTAEFAAGGDARRDLRANDPGPAGGRRPPFLYQQPAAAERGADAEQDSGAGDDPT